MDRGFNSILVLSLLLALKVRYSQKIWLLRGNHESKEINRCFGFYDECLMRYGSSESWQLLTDCYEFFPLAAIVDKSIFACHGGLSPDFSKIKEIEELNKTNNVPYDGALCDLLWSDPNPDPFIKEWAVSPRGAGYYFGVQITENFLYKNNLSKIVRAHQLTERGYYFTHNDCCITVFSAPNYCLRSNNKGAFVHIVQGKENLDIHVFEESENKPEPRLSRTVPEYFL